jgi:uncharacterized phage infection (PIP) family protein YhgE
VAGADSTIRVNIIGDAKSLTKAADKAEGAFGGMGKTALKAGAVIGGAFAVDAIVDFGAAALGEADRVADATGRIEDQLGDLAPALTEAADGFTKLGLSEGDMLDLEARIIDIGTAIGLTDIQLAAFADDAASTAGALALITDTDADTWIDLIGKAAGGATKPLKELGISLTDAEVNARAAAMTGKDLNATFTEGELAAARMELILEKLAPRIEEVKTGEADLEQQQAELQAKWETLTGKIGEAIEGPLNDLLGWIIAGIAGWEMFAHWLGENEQALRDMLGPLARVADAIGTVIGLFQELNKITPRGIGPGAGTHGPFNNPSFPGLNTPQSSGPVTVNVQGGSPEAIEQAVQNAIHYYNTKNGTG